MSRAADSYKTAIMPDGCRDLIIKRNSKNEPVWFVTDMAVQSESVSVAAGDCYNGFRLCPGVRVEQESLLACLQDDFTDGEIIERLHDCVVSKVNVADALACLSEGVASIAEAAALIGVQTRSLQRLLKRETGQGPAFWMRLARVRRAAAKIPKAGALADLAYDMGYSDQAHMTREFRHWLGATPRRIQRDATWIPQHLGLGYGA